MNGLRRNDDATEGDAGIKKAVSYELRALSKKTGSMLEADGSWLFLKIFPDL